MVNELLCKRVTEHSLALQLASPLVGGDAGEATALHDPASCSRMARMRACSSLEEVRTCIDAVDRQIIRLIAERRGYVLQASRFKKSSDDVQAPARVEQVVAKVRALACDEGIEPELVEALYRQMIARFISIELAAHRDQASTP